MGAPVAVSFCAVLVLLGLAASTGASPVVSVNAVGKISKSPTVQDRPTCQPGSEVPPNRVDTTVRLQQLRQHMIDHNIQAYIVTSEDAHLGEEVPPYDGRRGFISGFSGSAGTAVVTSTQAALWTDGRYFLQAEQQLDCNWILMKEDEKDVPTITGWLKEVLTAGQSVGADPLLIGIDTWNSWEQDLDTIPLNPIAENLIDLIWTVENGRPPPSDKPAVVHPIQFAGISWTDKLTSVRSELKRLGADSIVVSGLDEVAWLFNIRGSDIPSVPIVTSFAVVTSNEAHWFVDNQKVTAEVRQHLNTDSCGSLPCVRIHPYGDFINTLPSLVSASQKVLVPSKVSYSGGSSYGIYNTIPAEKRLLHRSPLVYLKARKNDVEVAGMKKAHIKDAVALCDFLSQLEEEVTAGVEWDELKVVSELLKYREQQTDNRGASFGTIAGFGANGAIIHYSPTPETNLKVDKTNLLLIDSGGQYLDGTTDVTRTLHFGVPSAEQRDAYTRVLMGAIDLAKLVFTCTTPDTRVDIITRKYLHDVGLDYLHGTGHGIGSYLGVHESPTQVRVYSPEDHYFEENYFFSDEPGYYKEKNYGIRLESILRVVPKTFATEFSDRFFGFEIVTLVPYEPKLIVTELMSKDQLDWLNKYHEQVLNIVGTQLLNQGRQRAYDWLVSKTACLGPYCPDTTNHARTVRSTHSAGFAFFPFILSLKDYFERP